MRHPILLTEYNMHKLNVREWGIPSFCGPGRMWRSEAHHTVTCLLPLRGDPAHLRAETRRLLIVDRAAEQWIPATWRQAVAVYAKEWPASSPKLRRVPWRPKPKPRPTKP